MSAAYDTEKGIAHDRSSHASDDEKDTTKPITNAFTSVDDNRDPLSYDDLPRKLILKTDLRLIPALSFMYGMSLIDRTDLPSARLNGADASLGLALGQRYTIITCLFFVTYIAFEIPANYFFKRSGISPRVWLPTATLAFGAIKLGSAWSPDWGTLAGVRVLLGVFEAALFPGCVFLISCWYPRHVLAKRITMFYLLGAALGGFGNIIGYGWGTLGKPNFLGWQVVFAGMGGLTILSALIGYAVIPHFPLHATNITEQERRMILKRIEIDRHDVVEEKLTIREVITHLGNIRIWAYGLLFCLTTLPVYAFAYFLPLIFRGFGYSTALSQILSAPPYIAALIYGAIVSTWSDRIKHRGTFVIIGACMGLGGAAGLGFGFNNESRLASAFFAQMGCQANVGMIVSWSSNNVRTQNQRAVNSAIVVAGGGLGGIIASVAFQSKDAPSYTPGIATVLASQVVVMALCLVLMAFYRIRNRQADQGQRVLEGLGNYRYTL